MRASRILGFFVIVAVISGLASAAWYLIRERMQPRPTLVVDAQNARPDGTIVGVPIGEGVSGDGSDKPGEAGLAGPGETLAMTDGGEGDAAKLCQSNHAALRDSLPPGGSVFGHLRSNEAPRSALVASPPGFGGGNCALIHGSMATSLRQMLAAARADDPAVGRAIQGISCFRSIERQAALYCSPDRIASRGYAGQARWVAPPGYSEHSTGLAIDFGNRNGNCNLEQCFKSDPVGRWLRENAARFGFRLSFPEGNAQGVSFEPWHYRYVGGGNGRISRATPLSEEESVAGPEAEGPVDVAPLPDEIITPNSRR